MPSSDLIEIRTEPSWESSKKKPEMGWNNTLWFFDVLSGDLRRAQVRYNMPAEGVFTVNEVAQIPGTEAFNFQAAQKIWVYAREKKCCLYDAYVEVVGTDHCTAAWIRDAEEARKVYTEEPAAESPEEAPEEEEKAPPKKSTKKASKLSPAK